MAELTGFAKNLKLIREKRNLTQRELAEKIGVSPQTISAYEKGGAEKGKNPTLEKVIDIADTLCVTLDELCGRDFKAGNEVKTLGEIARILCTMRDWETVTFAEKEVARFAENGDRTYCDFTPAILFDGGPLRKFLEGYAKLRQLRKEKTIDEQMFDDWVSLKVKELDSIPASSQLSEFALIDDDDDDLPF